MRKRRLWMFATALTVGLSTLGGWSNETRGEDQKPAVERPERSDTEEALTSEETDVFSSEAIVPDETQSEEVAVERVRVPLMVPADTSAQLEMATQEGVTASAQAPILVSASSQLSFQALLTDASGDPLPDGDVKLAFRIYRGAVLVEGPIQVSTPVVNGIVDTLVPVKNTSFDGGSRQLSVTLVNPAAGELLPRIQLGAVPYAFRVDRVASAELDDGIELGSASADGSLKVWNNSANAVGVELDGSNSAISTFGSDGLEQTRLHGQTWGELVLHGRPTENNIGAKLSVPSLLIFRPPPATSTWIDKGGQLQLYDVDGAQRLFASASTSGGTLQVYNGTGAITARLTGTAGDYETLGSFDVMDTLGGEARATLYKVSGGGRLIMRDETNRSTVWLGSSGTAGGFLEMYQKDGNFGVIVDGDASGTDGGGVITVYQADGGRGVIVDGDASGNDGGGAITIYQADGGRGVIVDGDAANSDDGGVISVYQADGSYGVVVDGDHGNNNTGGSISIYNDAGSLRMLLQGDESDASQILMYNAAGTQTIEIDADWASTGNGRIRVSELQILGGSDLSEQFDISPGGGEVKPGMVVSIDPATPGHLIVSDKAYDRAVAGIISGAGGVRTGMLMGQKDSEADGADAVALSGRVYCWCNASGGAIQPGDLLTTSNMPGHAMKVTDYAQSQGAIIGKAMTSLQSGTGLVLVLVSLQ